mgnify:CR=1 FL=1
MVDKPDKVKFIKLGHIGEKNNEQHGEIFDALPLKAKVCTMARAKEGENFAKFNYKRDKVYLQRKSCFRNKIARKAGQSSCVGIYC